MEFALLFCSFLCLVRPGWQYSYDRLSLDGMVSDGGMKFDDVMASDTTGMASDGVVSDPWFDDILTDGWNGVPRGCGGKPADIYFVLDTAGSTSDSHLAEQKRYLSHLAALFYLHKGSTRLGVVSYGYKPATTTRLGKYDTLASVQQAVEDTPRVGGSRRTAKALRYLRINGFSPRVSRQQVAHVVIMMTNGFSANSKQVIAEAEKLRQKGIYVYTVSVNQAGSRVNKGELSEMASRPVEDFVFTSDDWNILDSLIELLHIEECNYQVLPPLPGKEPVCVTRRPTELAFALEHLGLGSPKSEQILAFIQAMLAEVDPSSSIKAAILTSKDPVARYALTKQVDTVKLLEEKLGEVVFPDLSQLLKRARRTLMRGAKQYRSKTSSSSSTSLSSSPASEEDVQKVLLLFLDDSVTVTRKALSAARAARRSKVDTYVMYVGREGDGERDMEKVAAELASGDDHVIRVDSYKQLRSQETVVDTLRTLCRGL